MKSRRFLDSRVGYMFASIVTLLGMAAPALVPVSAEAAGVVTERSMALSSALASATGVEYTLTFTPAQNAGEVIVEFCDDSPIISTACHAPAGFSAAAATLPSGVTATATTLEVTKSLTAGSAATIVFNNIVNPSYTTDLTLNHGFYARIYTYTDATAAGSYTDAEDLGSYKDAGGIAMAITSPIQVSAAVRETMTFCVSKAAPDADCANTNAPTLELGHGTPLALDASLRDTAEAYAQISTNALNGAVVSMKTDNECGGLFRQGEDDATVCGIAPVGTGHSPITAGAAALFGLHVGSGVPVGTGSGTIVPGANYGVNSGVDEYGMNWVSDNSTGVGSTYGDPIFDTSEAPIDNVNVPLTFAATVKNTTAAGLYKANLNLIATGTY